jgi:hypothetical protein
MAEIKNTFLGAKMNRDIDDRILPKNEYRTATNVQINKSQNSDVGSLQTVLGNEMVVDFNEELGSNDLNSIGQFVDTANNVIYIFLTDYNDTTGINTYNSNTDNFICKYDISSGNIKRLVSGPFLNFSKSNPIIGVNLLEDLLFWTDNRNQPRRINVVKASDPTNNRAYYTTEDQISVAKINPVYAMDLYAESQVPDAAGEYETTMYDVVSPELPNGEINPYYNDEYIGDPSYLEDKFVRFSYRYKFEENEYSIFAPFTQIAYIPKQDGYFFNEDETAAYRSTIVSFMFNKVNNIFLQIKLPGIANNLQYDFKISEIEILYKESDSTTVQVVDIIPVSKIVSESGASDIYVYNYQSRKPFKTLPERDLIRVYDKTPVRALGQEIIGSRVVYSNYQDKQSYPKYLNYNVACNDKSGFNVLQKTTSIIEYPNHSVKQNRNYPVGVVLSDRFGRQSGVILSNAMLPADLEGIIFGASSLYVPYNKETTPGSDIPSLGLVNQWPGFSLKVLFNDPIDGTGINDWPGIYQSDPEVDSYNPLGWYSYKIVVKQTEQDYYNVYLPGILAAYPTSATLELGKTSHVVLIGDNINKVPRDLADVSSTQRQYRSSVKLYSRVENNIEPWNNQQFYPGNSFMFVNTISTNSSLFSTTIPPPTGVGYEAFYQVTSDPLIARISTESKIGITYVEVDQATVIRLAVCETEPFQSMLDIYWETSSSGIISELNEAILADTGVPSSIGGWIFSLFESYEIGDVFVENFQFLDSLGLPLDIDILDISLNVLNMNGTSRTDWFEIIQVNANTFNLVTNDYFYYGVNANMLESYRFFFTVTVGSTSATLEKLGALSNVAPVISNLPPTDYITLLPGTEFVYNFDGVNGSNVGGGKQTLDLTWSIPSASKVDTQEPVNIFVIDSNGIISNTDPDANGTYLITVRLTDAGGLINEFILTVLLSELAGVTVTVTEPDPNYPGYYFESLIPDGGAGCRGVITVQPGVTVRVRSEAISYLSPGTRFLSVLNLYDPDETISTDSEESQGDGPSIEYRDLTNGTFGFEIFVSWENGGGSGGMILEII